MATVEEEGTLGWRFMRKAGLTLHPPSSNVVYPRKHKKIQPLNFGEEDRDERVESSMPIVAISIAATALLLTLLNCLCMFRFLKIDKFDILDKISWPQKWSKKVDEPVLKLSDLDSTMVEDIEPEDPGHEIHVNPEVSSQTENSEYNVETNKFKNLFS